jgi:hypothetical protein
MVELNASAILAELRTLRSDEPVSVLGRLRELETSAKEAEPASRITRAAIAAALTVQAINYLCEGIERGQNAPEIKRRFGIAIVRAETWSAAAAGEPAEPKSRTGDTASAIGAVDDIAAAESSSDRIPAAGGSDTVESPPGKDTQAHNTDESGHDPEQQR